MQFNHYLKSRIANIKVRGTYKIDSIIINENNDECNFEAIKAKYIKTISTNEIDILFKNYINLGRKLYKINQDKIIKYKKYDIPFGTSLITEHTYNDETKKILKNWLEKQNYCVAEDKNLEKGYFVETNCLIDLSILSYLIFYSINNHYKSANIDNISFKTFIDIKADDGEIEKYLFTVGEIIMLAENSDKRRKYIRDESIITYDENTMQIKLVRVFQNIYSLFWYILKLFISYVSTNVDDNSDFIRICDYCEEPYFAKINSVNNICNSCSTMYNSDRRQRNRENKKNIEKINTLINKYEFSKETIAEVNELLSNSPYNHYNNEKIKEILNRMEKYVKPKPNQ